MSLRDLQLAVVIKARELIAKGWTQNTYARDANGHRVSLYGTQAASSYCASGALTKVMLEVDGMFRTPWSNSQLFWDYGAVPEALPLTLWNDQLGQTQANVLEAFDKVIFGLKAKS